MIIQILLLFLLCIIACEVIWTKLGIIKFFIIILLITAVIVIPNYSIDNNIHNIETSKEKIKELKVEYYNLEKKDGNQEKLQKKESEIRKIEEKLIKSIDEYNEILEKDRQRFVLFRLYFFREKIVLDEIKTTDQYIVYDYFKG